MTVSTKAKIGAGLLAVTFLAGCAAPGGRGGDGLPDYPTAGPAERTAGKVFKDETGILRHQNGDVVAVYGDPCSELKRSQAATRPSNGTQRAAGQIAGQVGGALRSGKNVGEKVGGAVAGGVAAIGIQIFGDKANQAINEDRINTLEGQCAQKTAYEGWKKEQKALGSDFRRAYTGWQNDLRKCITTEQKAGSDARTAADSCRRAYPEPTR